MSSRTSKKATCTGPKIPEPIVARKSAQQKRQLRKKAKKTETEKPKLTKPEIKSPKLNESLTCAKKQLQEEKELPQVIEQVEYYPNNLKRDISTKKIMLKPKHNFKVIASVNKRKMAIPQRGIKSPSPHKRLRSPGNLLKSRSSSSRNVFLDARRPSSPELSMQDMIRVMEANQSLSDEDFMEILTCPSPVWWEDPPDGRYNEDSIYTRSPDLPEITNKEVNRREIRTNTPSATTNKKKDERFVKKKQKLENLLGNIKNNTNKNTDHSHNEVKNKEMVRIRKISESTEGDISDMSFNEEEILNILENVDIPVEEPELPLFSNRVPVIIKKEKNEINIKNGNVVENLQDKRKIKNRNSFKNSVSDVDSIPDMICEINSNTDKHSDEIIILDSCPNYSLGINEDSRSLLDEDCDLISGFGKSEPQEPTDKEAHISVTNNNNDSFPNKKVIPDLNHLTEYITVYKIIPENNKSGTNSKNRLKNSEASNKTKLDAVRGKLNNFFKHCKSNRSTKKTESAAIPVTEETIDNKVKNSVKKTGNEEKNRLNSCEYCVVKTENGTKEFSCEKCEMAPTLTCGLCNFLADTKEIYRKHVSSCKDGARISWSHNLVLNQT